MRTSFFRLRYQLGISDAIQIIWKAETNKFNKLHLKSYKHPIYFRSFKEDFDVFDFILISKDYNFRLTFTPKTIIDGGANIGMAAVWFANKFPDAEIISVEPADCNFPLLQKNTELYKKVTAYKGGLWGNPGWLELVDKGNGHTSFEVRESVENQKNTIRAYTITELMHLHNWETIDVLKLDIEGSEKHVIMHGADEWLPKTKFIVVEFHDRRMKDSSKEFFRVLDKYNFSMEPLKECLLFYNEDLINMFAPYHQQP